MKRLVCDSLHSITPSHSAHCSFKLHRHSLSCIPLYEPILLRNSQRKWCCFVVEARSIIFSQHAGHRAPFLYVAGFVREIHVLWTASHHYHMGRRLLNKDAGIHRAPSSWSLFCQWVARTGVSSVQSRLLRKTPVNTLTAMRKKWQCSNCTADCQCLISAKDLRGQWVLIRVGNQTHKTQMHAHILCLILFSHCCQANVTSIAGALCKGCESQGRGEQSCPRCLQAWTAERWAATDHPKNRKLFSGRSS